MNRSCAVYVLALWMSCAFLLAHSIRLHAAQAAASPAYAIAEISVKDPVLYRKYIDAVTPVVASFGGKYIVRAGRMFPSKAEHRPADSL